MFIGIDGEMSGNDIENGAALIQIGVCLNGQTYVSGINPLDSAMIWQEEAAAVHNIKLEDIDTFPSKWDVDAELYDWLIENGAGKKFDNVPVGWNIAGFDIPFIRKYLPKTASILSYRTLDLNAVCFALDGKNGKSDRRWKKESKEYAEKKNPPTEEFGPHNAGWDAIMSLDCLEFLMGAINGK